MNNNLWSRIGRFFGSLGAIIVFLCLIAIAIALTAKFIFVLF